MADWLSNVQQKTKTAVSNGGGVAVGGKTQVQTQPRVQGKAAPAQNDWLNSVTSKGKVAYKPNQLISDIKAPIQPVMAPPPPKDNLLQKAGKLTGISTGEVKGAITKGIEFVKSQDNKKAITQEEVIQKGKDFFGKVKDIIVSTVEKETGRTKDKEAVYKKERNIPEAQALTFDQTRDFSSVGMLKLSKEDFEKKLEKMKAKPNKSNIDNYRIKNTEDTLKLIDETLAMPPQERVKRESLITGLALGRVSGNLATGFLGSLEGVANFIKWRGDVAESKGVSDFGETAAKRVNEWARETAPNNPELADELIQGVGSTAAFYLPGAGISSASSRLAMVSPKLATFFGIAASATLEAGTESGTTYQEALNMGKTREEADLAASRVFAGNVMFNLVTDKVGLFSDAEGLKKVFTSAISEGGQEAFQEALQNVNQDKAAGENVGKSFIMGLIVGGGMGAAIDSAVANPTITPEDRIKLLELGDEIAKAQGDPVAAERLAEEFIAKREALVKKMTMPEVDGQTSFTDTSGGTAFESDQTGSQTGVSSTVQQETIANDSIKASPSVKRTVSQSIEEVSVDKLDKYKEFDRSVESNRSTKEYAELKEDIKENGIKNPIVIKYNYKDGTAKIAEGNHRLAIAKELGIKTIPTRVEVVDKYTGIYQKGSIQPISFPGIKIDENNIPEYLRPSDILEAIQESSVVNQKTVAKPLEKQTPTSQKRLEEVSTPESREEAINQPVTTPKGVKRESRAYKNARDRIREEYQTNVDYRSLNIAEEAAKALEFAKSNPEQANRIARGLEKPPAGFTDTAISIAAAENAREAGDFKSHAQLEVARSLRQTRRGQEIVMEKGRVNENSTHHFVSQVLKARLEMAAKVSQLRFETDKLRGKVKSKSQIAVEKIDRQASGLKKKIDRETLSKLDSAQELLNKLTCKI